MQCVYIYNTACSTFIAACSTFIAACSTFIAACSTFIAACSKFIAVQQHLQCRSQTLTMPFDSTYNAVRQHLQCSATALTMPLDNTLQCRSAEITMHLSVLIFDKKMLLPMDFVFLLSILFLTAIAVSYLKKEY